MVDGLDLEGHGGINSVDFGNFQFDEVTLPGWDLREGNKFVQRWGGC